MIESKLQLISYILMVPIFIVLLLLLRWNYEIDGICAMGTLLISNGFLSMIGSRKHSESGRIFWLKKDYKALRFIEFDKEEYSRLPVIYLLITINFFISVILVALTFLFPLWNMILADIIVGCILGMTFIFSLVELIIDKVRQ